MKIFVTGYHRAGTHALAEYTSEQTGFDFVDESYIKFKDISKIKDLDIQYPNGYVLQCPFLSCDIDILQTHGNVMFATRDYDQIIRSMSSQQMTEVAWYMMNSYYNKFSDDPVWSKIEYKNKIDSIADGRCKYVGYYSLLLKVINYFRTKYYPSVQVRKLEEMPYYGGLSKNAIDYPLANAQLSKIEEFEKKCVEYSL